MCAARLLLVVQPGVALWLKIFPAFDSAREALQSGMQRETLFAGSVARNSFDGC